MKKIGIFHSIPTKSELQKCYLFFDEIQTSIRFLETTFGVFNDLELGREKNRNLSFLIEELKKLSKKNIIVLKEDIENRILPLIGSFDSRKIDQKLLKEPEKPEEEAIFQYFNSLKKIKNEFKLNIIGDIEKKNFNDDIVGQLSLSHDLTGNFLESIKSEYKNEDKKYEKQLEKKRSFSQVVRGAEIYSRAASGLLNSYFKDHTYIPILNSYDFNNSEYDSILNYKKQKVVNLVIKKFPIPGEGVDWEQIIEFKQDKKSMYKLRNLRLWIEDLSISTDDLSHINDKLEQLLYEYEERLKLHKIKYVHKGFKAILVPIIEIAENLVKFKFSEAAKIIFSIGGESINMLEEEHKIKGREVAYISEINSKLLR